LWREMWQNPKSAWSLCGGLFYVYLLIFVGSVSTVMLDKYVGGYVTIVNVNMVLSMSCASTEDYYYCIYALYATICSVWQTTTTNTAATTTTATTARSPPPPPMPLLPILLQQYHHYCYYTTTTTTVTTLPPPLLLLSLLPLYPCLFYKLVSRYPLAAGSMESLALCLRVTCGMT